MCLRNQSDNAVVCALCLKLLAKYCGQSSITSGVLLKEKKVGEIILTLLTTQLHSYMVVAPAIDLLISLTRCEKSSKVGACPPPALPPCRVLPCLGPSAASPHVTLTTTPKI